MQAYSFLVLANLAIQVVSGSFGKAASPVSEDSSMTDTVSLTYTQSEDCESGWHSWSTSVGRSASTTTVIVTESEVADSSEAPPSPSESSESIDTTRALTTTTTTTTNTVTVTASTSSDAFYTSPSTLESSQSAEDPPTTSEEPNSEIASSDSYASTTSTDLSSDARLATFATDPALPSPSSAIGCSIEPFNKTDMKPFFGFNVVNTEPGVPPSDPKSKFPYKSPKDWQTAFALLKQHFPHINAVRLYSTNEADGKTPHLMNAMDAAIANNLSILVGVWSGTEDRYQKERSALGDVIDKYSCDNFAAISVGNEDLNDINVSSLDIGANVTDFQKQAIADILVTRIMDIRKMVRDSNSSSCCTVPITHTDTWNEFSDTSKPWVPELIRAVDQATIVNIFPYWSDATVTDSWEMIAYQSNLTLAATKEYGKDVWLGETGWAVSQPEPDANFNMYGTNVTDAQQYFNQVGCQTLSGTGTAFYYTSWDGDALSQNKPSFGLFTDVGEPVLPNLNCSTYKPDMRMRDYSDLPAFMGVSQARQRQGV